MATVFVVGVAVIDFVFQVGDMPDRNQKYRADDAIVVGGGCAANAAVAIARHAGNVSLAARLGDDPVGDLIVDDLGAEGVDTAMMHRAPGGRSSFSSIYVDQAGERQIMNFRGDGLEPGTDWLDNAPEGDAILADNRWTAGTEKAMAIARARGIPGIIDAEDPIELSALSKATHIAFSRQGLLALVGGTDVPAALMTIDRQLGAWICATDGENGAFIADGETIINIPAFPVETRDTLGAGDIWHGVFALRLAEGASETDAVRYANAAAALKCQKFGGRAGCPMRAETDAFLKERSQCN